MMRSVQGEGSDRWFRRTGWTMAAALAALLAGCSGNHAAALGTPYPVKGKVTLPDDKPLPDVNVVFSGPASAVAKTKGDGTFAFDGEKGGLPEGEYQVRLEVAEMKKPIKNATLPFPSRYLDEDASGLRAKVTAAGPNDFEFKLTKGNLDIAKSPGGPRGAK
jgi:hypothetical protein